MNRNFYTNLKANNKMFYIGMFIILLSLVDVFINSFLRFNTCFGFNPSDAAASF